VNARAADYARALLHAPVVKELRPDGSLRRQIVATRGQWDDRTAAMMFESGWTLELPVFSIRTKDVKLQVRLFERLEVRGFPPPERWSGVRTLRDLLADGQFEALSLSELQMERVTTSRQARPVIPRSDAKVAKLAQVPTLTFAIHDRLAAPLVCVALVLIGCPLGVRAPRAPSISPLGRALMVLLVYFAVWLTASHFGKSGASVPLLWAYLPLLLLIGAGFALLRRKAL
jgi:lipopolysaccharide export LptBFGC system permease protein LptF